MNNDKFSLFAWKVYFFYSQNTNCYDKINRYFCIYRKILPMHDLDRTELALLAELQVDARLTIGQLAERVALSPSPCWRRVKRLEEAGYIQAYRAVLSCERLGYGVTAFVSVMMSSHSPEACRQFEAQIAAIPRIVACHHLSGRYDYLLEVVATDLKGFGDFMRDVLQPLPGVKEVNSSFSLRSVKNARLLPLPNA
jgi:Lrp/AsnC family leucine-responsive transcriptional regulator